MTLATSSHTTVAPPSRHRPLRLSRRSFFWEARVVPRRYSERHSRRSQELLVAVALMTASFWQLATQTLRSFARGQCCPYLAVCDQHEVALE
jgi:hypothetical protein